MPASPGEFHAALERAQVHAEAWLGSLPTRAVGPALDAERMMERFAVPLQAGPRSAVDVVDELARRAEPGLMASPSGRFFGWVMGGTLPAALAADWLVSAWDQNAALRFATPATAAAEHAAGVWLLELLGLPSRADVGFTTGATAANFVGLAAARHAVLTAAGWDLLEEGLSGAPRIRVLAGADHHASVDLALQYLGLGRARPIAVDGQGRLLPSALEQALAEGSGPAIVCLQAGNLHSGASDPLGAAARIAHRHGAWAHVDGAFGLWAAASSTHRDQLAGVADCDSWATDAHKTLNVPYDCGVAIVARPEAVRAVFGVHASYLVTDSHGPGDPFEKVPEFSRRARGVTVWAALRSLGRNGVAELVDTLVANAQAFGRALATLPGVEVLNEVVFTQVCVSFGSDARTRAVTARIIADGAVWMSGSRWSGREVLRISVSNWSTDAADVTASLEAIVRAMAAVDGR